MCIFSKLVTNVFNIAENYIFKLYFPLFVTSILKQLFMDIDHVCYTDIKCIYSFW